ncbi:MAG: MFS transporter [Thiotrichales bacterium]|nr:MAG: MFS transporter [Thiotrichales bacterium]
MQVISNNYSCSSVKKPHQVSSISCLVKAWVIWIVAASFYSYEFFLRISPSVMVADLMHSLKVSAQALGTLSACYYYAYAVMQIPVGILLDQHGVKRLLVFAAAMVAVGSVMFAMADTLWVVCFGRVLMGIGSAFSFVGCLKLAANWFAAGQFSVVIGLTNMLGVLGAIGASAPLAYLVENFGWRHTMLIAGIVGALLAILIKIVVQDEPGNFDEVTNLGSEVSAQDDTETAKSSWTEKLYGVVRCPLNWLIAIYGGLMVAPIAGFTELWGVPFFMQAAHLSRPEAAGISSIVFMGIALGGPINGWISGIIGKRKPLMFVGAIGACLCLFTVLHIPQMNLMLLSVLLFMFGFFTSSMLLAFVLVKECNPPWVTGIVIGFTNMIVMLGGTIFQPLLGWLLDKEQSFNVAHHLQLSLSTSQYQHVLLLLPACQVAALIVLLCLKETHCRRRI